jgi:hypothetical protein
VTEDRSVLLKAYVKETQTATFAWGVSDCTRWAADWAERVLGQSLNLPTYQSESQAKALIEPAGSLHALWSRHLSHAGIHEVYEPRCGDVSVIETKRGQIGSIICAGGLAMIRVENSSGQAGLTVLRPRNITGIWRP